MISNFLIPFRETLEAALLIGVILAYLQKTGASRLNKYVFSGSFLAVIASLLTAILFNSLAGGFSGKTEEIFEGGTMLLAAAVLTYVIYWMAVQTRYSQRIEEKVNEHLHSGKSLGLFAMSFFAVYREGVETVLFMGATFFAANGESSLLFSVLGIIAAVILGFLIFKTAIRFNLKTIFNSTSILLVLFAAGLVAHGVHEFQEAGVLPILYGKVWNTNGVLDEKSLPGTFAKALFGYNGDPFELEALSYFAYLAIAGIGYFYLVRPLRKKHAVKSK